MSKLPKPSLDLIDKIFFKPIMQCRPKNISEDEFKRAAMHLTSRTISVYESRWEAPVGGVWVEGGTHPQPGKAYGAKVKKGEQLIVRYDEHYQRIDVENKGVVRRLTWEDWTALRPCLKLVGGEEL